MLLRMMQVHHEFTHFVIEYFKSFSNHIKGRRENTIINYRMIN